MLAPLEHGTTCDELQKFEDKTLAAFESEVAGWSRDLTCPTLAGWTVIITMGADADNGEFQSLVEPGNWVYGQTYLRKGLVLVGLNRWGDSALAHELAHVISYGLEDASGHDLWSDRGICKAINKASGRFRCLYADPSLGQVEK